MDATVVLLEEFHVAVDVRSRVVPSENVPIAKNCMVSPAKIVGLDGVTVIDTRTGEVTVREAGFEVIPDMVAVIVVVPWA